MKRILRWFGYVHQEDVLNALVEYRISKGEGIDKKIESFAILIKQFEEDNDITSDKLTEIIQVAPNLKKEFYESAGAAEFVTDFFKKVNKIDE